MSFSKLATLNTCVRNTKESAHKSTIKRNPNCVSFMGYYQTEFALVRLLVSETVTSDSEENLCLFCYR